MVRQLCTGIQAGDRRARAHREFRLWRRKRSAGRKGDVHRVPPKTSARGRNYPDGGRPQIMVAILEKRREFRDLDWQTALIAIMIAGFGVWQIHNAVPTEGYWSKQIIGIAIAVVAFVAVCMTDYRRIIDAAPVFYVIGLVLLLLVLTPLGVQINGQKAWVRLPIIGQFQPSEFMKIPTVLMLAKYFGAKKGNILTLKEMLIGA